MRRAISFLLVAVLACCLWWLVASLADPYSNPDQPPPDQVAEQVDTSLEGERSGRWPSVRRAYIEDNPVCVACGSDDELNVHHIKPFHTHPELELEPSNLITACREHHFSICHDPDGPWGPEKPNWRKSNLNARSDMQKWRRMHNAHSR